MTTPMPRLCHDKTARACLVVIALVFAAAAAALAQDDPHAACGSVGWVPREILERPVALRTGIGNSHDAVTTASKEAQAFYDQGLAYLHSYVWVEAARSFRQALRHDPDLALAWVGLSRVFSGLEDPAAARDAQAKAQERAPKASPRERRRIALRAKQLEALDDLGSVEKHLAYKKALDDALALDFTDAELWCLRGNAEEASAAGRGQRGGVASVAFYRQALDVFPDHFAAHHYLVHSYENINQIELALRHGALYAGLASAIPHAHHMYGHDLRRAGRVEDAIAAFTRADEIEKAYYLAENIPAGMDWHHPHNLDLLGGCYQHQGRLKTADRHLLEAAAFPAVTDYLEFNRKGRVGLLLAARRNDEALRAARELAQGKWTATRVVGYALAGQALLAMGRLPEAEAELRSAQGELDAMIDEPGQRLRRSAASPYVDGLRGEVLLRKGQRAEARALLEDVQTRIRAVPGPDAWTDALFRLEAIARAAHETGDFELLEHTALQMKDHDPAYAGTRYALALVAEHKGDREAARREFGAAIGYWQKADPELPELLAARARLAALAEPEGVGERAAARR
jgi:tetratricopeptide (TPR) repeat protein